jgi:hypothetical protein
MYSMLMPQVAAELVAERRRVATERTLARAAAKAARQSGRAGRSAEVPSLPVPISREVAEHATKVRELSGTRG